MKSDVTILICTYNREKYISYCVESALSQTVPADEIVIVDDGSEDSTQEILKKFSNKIKVFKKQNGGKAKALNFALPFVESKYLWIMDDDDLCLPNAIEAHLKILNSDDKIDYSYSWFYRGHENLTNLGRLDVYKEERPLKVPEEDLFIRLMASCFIGHPAIVARTDCYRKLGGFNEHLFRCQDYEMLLRLALNHRGAYLDKPTFICRTHTGVRGPQHCRVDFSENEKVFNRFNQTFIAPYYDTLPLEKYSTAEIRALPADIQGRALLIHRATIMARHSLWKQFFDDLNRVCCENSAGKRPLDKLEKELVREAINYSDWHQFSQIDGLLSDGRLKSRSIRLSTELLVLLWGAFARQIHRNFRLSRLPAFARIFSFLGKIAFNSFSR